MDKIEEIKKWHKENHAGTINAFDYANQAGDDVQFLIAELERSQAESLRHLQDLNDKTLKLERLKKENGELIEEIESLHSIANSIANNSPTEKDVRDAYHRGRSEEHR